MKKLINLIILLLLLSCNSITNTENKELATPELSPIIVKPGIYGKKECRPSPFVHEYTVQYLGNAYFKAWQVYAPDGTELDEHNDFEWDGYSNWMRIAYNKYGEGTYHIVCSVRYPNNKVIVYYKSVQVFKNPRG